MKKGLLYAIAGLVALPSVASASSVFFAVAVPEPSTMVLLAIGGLGAAAVKHYRSRR